MTKVKLDDHNLVCDHCGKANLKRTLSISHEGRRVNIGVTCAGKIFEQNLSGNPYKAAQRLAFHINNNLKENIEDLISF